LHTRLSIIDPTPDSSQPFVDPSSGSVISYNGEIYNYKDLREELTARGVRFSSSGDTEVILQGYLLEGIAFFAKLRGMFAFAIADKSRDALILFRDYLGIKPLYVANDLDGGVIFCSSPSGLGHVIDATKEPAAAISLAVLGCVIEPLSSWTGVTQLPPGVVHEWSFPEGKPRLCKLKVEPAVCWDAPVVRGSRATEHLFEALLDSVRMHLTADVPVAIFQSAGVDSTVISGLAKLAGHNPTLLTMGFEEFRGTSLDEVPGAVAVAEALGMRHEYVYLAPTEVAELSAKFFHEMESPTIDGLNNYLMAWFCRKQGFKVALSGTGGDEIFGGYPTFRELPLMYRIGAASRNWPFRWFVRFGLLCASAVASKTYPKLRYLVNYIDDFRRLYLARRAFYLPEELHEILHANVLSCGLSVFETAYTELTMNVRGCGRAAVRECEEEVYLRNMLLRDADWTGMAHGVEIRVPFVDVNLRRKLCGVDREVIYTKADLRALVNGIDDRLGAPRRKTGFYVPRDRRSAGAGAPMTPLSPSVALRNWVREVLAGQFPEFKN
jgi:asparagine synthase (glutamine-hydrolysing)